MPTPKLSSHQSLQPRANPSFAGPRPNREPSANSFVLKNPSNGYVLRQRNFRVAENRNVSVSQSNAGDPYAEQRLRNFHGAGAYPQLRSQTPRQRSQSYAAGYMQNPDFSAGMNSLPRRRRAEDQSLKRAQVQQYERYPGFERNPSQRSIQTPGGPNMAGQRRGKNGESGGYSFQVMVWVMDGTCSNT